MKTAGKYRIDHIVKSLVNGQFEQAKEFTVKGCKTKPEKMAFIVGQVVGALCDEAGYHNNPDLAVKYLNLFDKG